MSQSSLLSELLIGSAERHQQQIAVSFEDSELSWVELDNRVGALAAALVDAGVQPGDRVGIYLHKSIESLVAVHGILRAGAAYVPIDPMAPIGVVASVIDDCRIDVLISHQLRRSGVDRLCELVDLRAVIGLDAAAQEAAGDSPSRFVSWDEVNQLSSISPVTVDSDDLAYVIYTSGSTGAPKGIMHTHRSGMSYVQMSAALYGLGPHDRMANFAPLHFDQSTFEFLAGIGAGSQVVLIPEPHLRLPASLTQYIADQGCTTLYTVPSLFRQMLTRGALADRDLSAVRWVLPGGEVFPLEPLRQLIDLLPNARFSNVYGPAEVNQCSYYHFDRAPSDGKPLPIGYPCPGVELLVVDAQDEVITGSEQGQLLVRSTMMMAGYWNRPDLNAQGFVERVGPDGHSQRWYRTGDIVSWDGSCLRFYGRGDNQIKIRGNRVELEMVEAAVGSLEEIEQTVVGVRVDGEGESHLVARYVATEVDADSRRWRRILAGRLPNYAVPTVYEPVDRFPLTPSGKIDRRTARAAIAEPTPPDENVGSG